MSYSLSLNNKKLDSLKFKSNMSSKFNIYYNDNSIYSKIYRILNRDFKENHKNIKLYKHNTPLLMRNILI